MKYRVLLAVAAAQFCAAEADAQPIRKALNRMVFGTPAAQVCAECQLGKTVPLPMAGPGPTTVTVQGKLIAAPGGRKLNLHPFRVKIVDGLVAKGVDRADAERVVGQLGDGTLLKLLIENLPEIIKIVELLLPLFADKMSALYDPGTAVEYALLLRHLRRLHARCYS